MNSEVDGNRQYSRRAHPVSNIYGLKNLLSNGACAFLAPTLAVAIALMDVAQLLPLVFLSGPLAYRAQFVLHDASHRSLLRSASVADFLATAVGVAVGVDFQQYKRNHLDHHRFAGTSRDPQYGDFSDPTSSSGEFISFLLSPLFGYRLFSYLRRELKLGPPLKKASARRVAIVSGGPPVRSPRSAKRIIVLFHSSLALVTLSFAPRMPLAVVALTLFYCALASFSLTLARWRGVAEHQTFDTPLEGFSRNHKKQIFDRLLLSGSNFNFHLTHHLFPTLPPNYLPEVTRLEGLPVDQHSMVRTLIVQTSLRLKR